VTPSRALVASCTVIGSLSAACCFAPTTRDASHEDTVVSTLVLCTVDDVPATLAEIARVLRPGGRLLFAEHVRSDDPKLARWQDRLEGSWKFLGHGCRCNRDTLAARYVKLRALASPNLEVTIEPERGEVVAGGRLLVKVKVRCDRVGQHGVHGLALEVYGAPGMFEVPLTFANPYGLEVLPRPFATYLTQPRGGRSHLVAASGRPGRQRGEGSDLRELRGGYGIRWHARSGVALERQIDEADQDRVLVCRGHSGLLKERENLLGERERILGIHHSLQ